MLDLIAWRAKKSGRDPAVFFNGRWYSYNEMNLRAQRMANRLKELGVVAGDRVSVLALNHLVHIDLLLAAPKLGILYAPLNFRLSLRELQQQVRSIRPSLLFVDSRSQSLAEQLGVPWTPLFDYKAWLAAGNEAPLPSPSMSEESPWMLLFTSGSTAEPKGALLSYRQVLLNARVTADTWGLQATDCTLQCVPCFHSSMMVLALPLLFKGGRVVLASKFDADECLGSITQHQVTQLFLPPTNLQTLAQHYGFPRADFASLRWIMTGGAPCAAHILQRYQQQGVPVYYGYGLTEAGVNCFGTLLQNPAAQDGSLGQPLPGVNISIRDPQGYEVRVGEVGELHISGPMLFLGYWEAPALTNAAMKDGWLATGDLAAVNSAGDVRIMGRLKELYISGGEQIYPQEVEAVLSGIPGVQECAVIGVPDLQWGEVGLAAVVPAQGDSMDPEWLRAQMRNALAGYKLPKHIHFLRSIPRTALGKVARPDLMRLLDGPITISVGTGSSQPPTRSYWTS